MTKSLILAAGIALATVVSIVPAVSLAAPGGLGACCQTTNGCCPPFGDCRIATEVGCGGEFEQYMGEDTDCISICSPTTTTTLPASGACCHLFNGCCDAPAELKQRGLPGPGTCRQSSPGECNGIADTYKGDDTTCEELCPLQTTTTTIPQGACCEPGGACLDVMESNCVIGDYQGDGTACATIECPQPTTTTTEYLPTTTSPDTTTTTEPLVVLCGDANSDGEISSVDALIALRTSVGTSQCPETRCDYNGSGEVQTSDALSILRVSVGQVVVPMCPVL